MSFWNTRATAWVILSRRNAGECGFFWTTTHPRRSGIILPGTSYERGWAELSNGELLRLAEEAGFDVMITTDQRIPHQQNLAGRKLAIVVLSTNDWARIRKSRPAIVDAVSAVAPGSFVEVEIPAR